VKRFLGALQFLTILPIRGSTSSPGQAAIFFPITGMLLGAAAGLVCRWTGALFALAFLAIAAGCLHEDGLADVADAFRAGRTPDTILAILKDSRIGTYGAMALIATFAIRWQALSQLRVDPVYGLSAALGLSRSAMVVLAASTPSAGDGLGRMFSAEISRTTCGLVVVQAVALCFIAGWRYAVPLIAATALTIAAARAYFIRRIGGANGDCLGATCQAVETVNLVILSCHLSF